MKTIKSTLLIALFAVVSQFAQAQKTAHIHFLEVIAALPDTKKVQTEIEKYGKTYQNEIETKSAELKNKFQKYQTEANSTTPEINKQRDIELNQLQVRIQQIQQAASQDLQKKEADLMNPIIKKVNDAIKAYAKTNGIKYVLDSRTLIYADGDDISDAIKAKLGVTPVTK